MLFAAGKHAPVAPPRNKAPLNGRRAFRSGYATSITNPKAAAFFGSIFVSVLPPDCPASIQVTTVIALTAASAAWHCGLALT